VDVARRSVVQGGGPGELEQDDRPVGTDRPFRAAEHLELRALDVDLDQAGHIIRGQDVVECLRTDLQLLDRVIVGLLTQAAHVVAYQVKRELRLACPSRDGGRSDLNPRKALRQRTVQVRYRLEGEVLSGRCQPHDVGEHGASARADVDTVVRLAEDEAQEQVQMLVFASEALDLRGLEGALQAARVRRDAQSLG
jgi:hypothetical protein